MKSNRWIALITAIVLSSILFAGTVLAGNAAPETTGVDVSDPATTREENFGYHPLSEFTAETLDGGTFTPDDLKDYDLTIVYFWSATCGYCVEELPALAELMEDLPSNVQLITWCPDGGVYHDTVVKMLDRRGLDAVTIVSGEEDIDLLIKKLLYTPMALFLDKDGYMVIEPLIGAPEDPIAVYHELIDTALETLGVEKEETETEKPEE